MDDKDVQCWNAKPPMESTLLGITNEAIAVHHWKE